MQPPTWRRLCASTPLRYRSTGPRVNRLNVYPVPDGDTGTNMSLTLEAVRSELDAASQASPGGQQAGPDMDAVAHAMSHGSLMGARGNSGVILSRDPEGHGELDQARSAS